ncbi:MAG: tetratricopeptide repeat protein [Flammeovirgaceae bacterium]
MLKTTNYLEETKPLFRLLQTEAFRFVIVHYNHFDSVTRLKNDLKSRFPNRNARTINARKINYRQLLDAYYDTATGFFFVDNFEEIIKDPSIYAGLNQRRDKLAKYPIAFIAFIPHSQEQLYARQIMEKMPDLWSFRSLMLTLLQPLPQTNNEGFQGLESTRTSLGGKTDEEKQTELERLLQEIEANPNELALVQTLYAQVIDLQIDLRLYGEALLSLEKLEAFELTGEQQEEVWYNRGQVYKKQGRLAEAIVAFEKAAQIAKAHIEKQADYQEFFEKKQKKLEIRNVGFLIIFLPKDVKN